MNDSERMERLARSTAWLNAQLVDGEGEPVDLNHWGEDPVVQVVEAELQVIRQILRAAPQAVISCGVLHGPTRQAIKDKLEPQELAQVRFAG